MADTSRKSSSSSSMSPSVLSTSNWIRRSLSLKDRNEWELASKAGMKNSPIERKRRIRNILDRLFSVKLHQLLMALLDYSMRWFFNAMRLSNEKFNHATIPLNLDSSCRRRGPMTEVEPSIKAFSIQLNEGMPFKLPSMFKLGPRISSQYLEYDRIMRFREGVFVYE